MLFTYVNVSTDNAWITIRDGETSLSPLLTFGSPTDKVAANVTSSSKVLRLEMNYIRHGDQKRDNRTFGFLAIYKLKSRSSFILGRAIPISFL